MPSQPSVFTVAAWSAWSPERAAAANWLAWAGGIAPATESIAAPALPLQLRRRVSPIGQRMLAACLACADGASAGRYVFASRHGEMTRTMSIMESLAANELPSPADFSLSVHNALAGLLSIQMRNTAGHTALASGPDTFGYALIDAIGYLAENRAGSRNGSVLVCFGDDVLPGPYGTFSGDDRDLPMVLALLLKTPGPGDDALALSMVRNETERPSSQSLATEFLRFLLGRLPAHSASAARTTWSWRRVE